MLNIDNKYTFGDIIYLKTDKEQLPRIVTEIVITKGDLIYGVYAGVVYSKHYDYEISATIDVLQSVT